jgi:hypothetical protein
VFWGAGDELDQALPLLPFLDGLRVREPSLNLRRDTIVRLLRGEAGADSGADVPTVLTEQLLALVAKQCAVRPVVLVSTTRSGPKMPLLPIGMMRPAPQRDDLLAVAPGGGDMIPGRVSTLSYRKNALRCNC